MASVGILHPGEMGAEVGSALREVGHEVLWVAAGRSGETAARAERAGLEAVGSIGELTDRCEAILSICPPHAAVDVAASLAGFDGVFVEANAISPGRTRKIAAGDAPTGARYVDGGIIGPPPVRAGSTRIYLSGEAAPRAAELFAGARIEGVVVDGGIGRASALKMAYAAWTKGRIALLLDARALAEAEGVEEELTAEWQLSQPGALEMLPGAEAAAEGKGWRWIAEMEEIAATFGADALPDGFHRAAAEVFRNPARYVREAGDEES